jgi:hypothetical protein
MDAVLDELGQIGQVALFGPGTDEIKGGAVEADDEEFGHSWVIG